MGGRIPGRGICGSRSSHTTSGSGPSPKTRSPSFTSGSSPVPTESETACKSFLLNEVTEGGARGWIATGTYARDSCAHVGTSVAGPASGLSGRVCFLAVCAHDGRARRQSAHGRGLFVTESAHGKKHPRRAHFPARETPCRVQCRPLCVRGRHSFGTESAHGARRLGR